MAYCKIFICWFVQRNELSCFFFDYYFNTSAQYSGEFILIVKMYNFVFVSSMIRGLKTWILSLMKFIVYTKHDQINFKRNRWIFNLVGYNTVEIEYRTKSAGRTFFGYDTESKHKYHKWCWTTEKSPLCHRARTLKYLISTAQSPLWMNDGYKIGLPSTQIIKSPNKK